MKSWKLRFSLLCVAALTAFAAVMFHPAHSATAKNEPLPTFRPNLGVMKIAHRGSKKFAPENTIPAMEKAIELGFDYIELDVRYTKDGAPVILHDESLFRTTGVFKTLAFLTLKQIKKLDAGGWFGKEFKGTRIPTFEEALQTMHGRAKLYLDQKEPPNEALIELLKKYDYYPRNIVLVGGTEMSRVFSKLDPAAPVMPSCSSAANVKDVAEEFPNAIAINTNHNIITPELVDEAHARGIMVFVNTLGNGENPETMRRMIEAGVDAIQTDEPLMLNEVIEKMKAEKK